MTSTGARSPTNDRTCSTIVGSIDEPSINRKRWASGCSSSARPVVLADFDVDADHEAIAAEQLEDRRRERQRAAVGDAGLDDDLRLDSPDQLLDRDDVLRVLDDRQAEPVEVVRVAVLVELSRRGSLSHADDVGVVGQAPRCLQRAIRPQNA